MRADMPVPQRAVILARESVDFEEGVGKQVTRLRKLAAHHGWTVGPERTHVLIENDTSAYSRKVVQRLPSGRPVKRTDRPVFQGILDMLYKGEADGLVADDLDRIVRDPRDCEDLIDVVEEIEGYRVPIATVSGGIVMADDTGVLMSRFKTASSNMESRNTSRRTRQGKEARAAAGLPNIGGGLRPYGYDWGGMELIEDEAGEIRRAAKAILGGATIYSVIKSMQSRGVPTVCGGDWNKASFTGTMLNPRIAGLSHYKGMVVGKAQWPAIISEEEWREVRAILQGRAKARPGNKWVRKYLGSRIYECGSCGDGTTLIGASGQYRCDYRNLARHAERADEVVTGRVTERLSRPEAAVLLRPRADAPDLKRLAAKAAELRAARDNILDLVASRTYTAAQARTRVAKIDRELKDAEAQMDNSRYGDDPLAGLAGNPDARGRWERDLTLEQKRAILARLARVVILPAYCPKFFNPDEIRVTWLR
jgi:DNA invertase Pin-like site-specific DNA recombinase